MDTRRDVFQAIADPTRRQIISLLAQRPLNVNTIAEKFKVTRQAVSLHVKILAECGLVVIKQQGRERYCEAKLQQLDEVADWVSHQRTFWKQQFGSLDKYLKHVQIKSPRKNNSKNK